MAVTAPRSGVNLDGRRDAWDPDDPRGRRAPALMFDWSRAVQLSPQMMEECAAVMRMPECYIPQDIIVSHLTSKGIRIEEDEPIFADEDERQQHHDFMASVMAECCERMVLSINTYGYVAWTWIHHPRWGSYQSIVDVGKMDNWLISNDAGQRSLRLTSRTASSSTPLGSTFSGSSREEDAPFRTPAARVSTRLPQRSPEYYVKIVKDPVGGILTSSAALLVPRARRIQSERFNYDVATSERARQTMFVYKPGDETKSVSDLARDAVMARLGHCPNPSSASGSGSGGGVGGDGGLFLGGGGGGLRTRSTGGLTLDMRTDRQRSSLREAQAITFSKNMGMYAEYRQAVAGGGYLPGSAGGSGPFKLVPGGYKPVPGPPPPEGPDLGKRENAFAEESGLVIGVPPMLTKHASLNHNKVAAAGKNDPASRIFRNKLLWWSSTLSSIFEQGWACMYYDVYAARRAATKVAKTHHDEEKKRTVKSAYKSIVLETQKKTEDAVCDLLIRVDQYDKQVESLVDQLTQERVAAEAAVSRIAALDADEEVRQSSIARRAARKDERKRQRKEKQQHRGDDEEAAATATATETATATSATAAAVKTEASADDERVRRELEENEEADDEMRLEQYASERYRSVRDLWHANCRSQSMYQAIEEAARYIDAIKRETDRVRQSFSRALDDTVATCGDESVVEYHRNLEASSSDKKTKKDSKTCTGDDDDDDDYGSHYELWSATFIPKIKISFPATIPYQEVAELQREGWLKNGVFQHAAAMETNIPDDQIRATPRPPLQPLAQGAKSGAAAAAPGAPDKKKATEKKKKHTGEKDRTKERVSRGQDAEDETQDERKKRRKTKDTKKEPRDENGSASEKESDDDEATRTKTRPKKRTTKAAATATELATAATNTQTGSDGDSDDPGSDA